MKITSLVENTTQNNHLIAEHGLSLYIETAEHKILFDMGQSDAFYSNAQQLGIDLSKVDIAVLSHGHYDHGGGLEKFLEINSHAPVYVSRYAFEPHYNGEKNIGISLALKDNPRIVFADDITQITENLTLYSCNQNSKNYELGSFGLNMMQDGELVPDDFRHEHYLLIKDNNKEVLISGCSHKGIMDITRWFSPDVLVGGFHFSKLPLDSTLSEYAKYLNSFDTDFYTCHCTGVEQFEFMKSKMSRLNYLSTGQCIKI